MNLPVPVSPRARVVYPESDGKPMADNTLQFQWIVTLQGNLDALFSHRTDVFVAGDLLWYPVEGNPRTCVAPDVMVVFGRPRGHRPSYLQWLEDDIAPQVVFEVLSPGNRFREMLAKFRFYDQYGVEEYYLLDPDHLHLEGWRREGDGLVDIPEMNGWVSPRLGIRFDVSSSDLVITGPDGKRFLTYLELAAARQQAEDRASRLAAQLRALGIEPEA